MAQRKPGHSADAAARKPATPASLLFAPNPLWDLLAKRHQDP
jgi:hypothetical protein